ncbi:MAG: YgfZ/GcvT domain-containing protein [Candidatus Acidiferrales bacterium]
METPLLHEERSSGAEFAEYSGVLLPRIFAGFDGEYRAAREACALFDTSWHATFSLTGHDRVRYLNAVVSNDVKTLEEGRGVPALLLNPQGRILAELEIYARAERLLLRTHAAVRERTRETLEKYIIMDDAELTDATDETASMGIEGPRAAEIILETSGVKLEDLPEMSVRDVKVENIACQVVRHSGLGMPGAEWIAPRAQIAALWKIIRGRVEAKGGRTAGMAALESLRLEAGIPFFPADFNDTVIPHEAGVEATHISFSKGCYTGQEIVERVRSRGHVNRRRVKLQFSTREAPAFATRLTAAGQEVGMVTSAAFSPQAGVAIGMGYVRREHGAPGSSLQFAGGSAEVKG